MLAEPSVVETPSSREDVSCAHCALPVPSGLIEANQPRQFCCHGCKAAWQLIHDEELTGYYAICEQLDTAPPTAVDQSHTFDEYDHPAFTERYVRNLPGGQAETRCLVSGLHCAACVWLLEKLPRLVPGVLEARVDLARRAIRIRWDRQCVSLSSVARRLADLGYSIRPAEPAARSVLEHRENRAQLIRLAVAGACAGNAMLLAIALYAGWFSGIAADHLRLLRGVSAVLGLISLAWPGAVFYRGAWNAIRTRTPHMDVALTLGLLAGGVMGIVNTVRGTGEIYFDSLCMLVFVLLVGRYVQFRQQSRAAERVTVLRTLIPRTAWRVVAGGPPEKVPVEALAVGDEVEVRVGDALPADGEVAQGQSRLDQSLLSGESAGVPVQIGDSAPAGAINLSAPIRLKVTAIGEETRVGRLSALVESASLAQTPLVELAHRVSGFFLGLVLLIAVGTLVAWWPAGMEQAVNHTIALLIVACPCALGLATPLTIAVALGRAASNGLLIRGGDVFERLARRGTIWLDKTGTLTTGQMTLLEWRGDRTVIPQILALEQGITHPIAQSLVAALNKEQGRAIPVATDVTYCPGQGVSGRFDGETIRCGSARWLKSHDVDIANDETDGIPAAQVTRLYVARNSRLVAVILLGDKVRDEARAAVASLRRAGWQVGMLSGDQPEIARSVAEKVDIPADRVIAGVLPEDKLAIVEREAKQGRVVMVGDGVNDAAALAAADVGIAVQGGAEASLRAAKVYLTRPGLEPLLDLMTGSDRTMTAIHRGLALSLGYNVLAIGLAAAGAITPLAAAILMPVSSLSVIALATMQNTFPQVRKRPGEARVREAGS